MIYNVKIKPVHILSWFIYLFKLKCAYYFEGNNRVTGIETHMDRFSYIYLFKYDLKSESENQCTFYLSYAGMQIQPTKVQIQHEILFFFKFLINFDWRFKHLQQSIAGYWV